MGKSSRGTSLDTRRRQDAACAGIGKRRLVRLHLWKGAKKGKRRQHGGQTSDTEMGDGNAAIDEFIAHAPDIPVYNDIPYTRAQQCSPDRDNRGKRRHQGKQSKSKRGKSLYELLHGPEAEQTAFDWCVEVGLLSDGRDPGIRPYLCPKCQTAATWKTVVSRTGQGMSYQCPKPCRYRESVTARETDLFLPRVPLSKQILVLYMLIHHNQPGIEKLALDANMDEHCVNTLVGKTRKLVSWWMARANLVLQVGGLDEDVEADEVSFRNAITGDDDKPKIQWTRFVGIVRRGSSLYYWGELDTRVTSAKQGGGGKLGNLAVLREMAYFYQWLYWRSTDPIRDANHGRHKEVPATGMLQELGAPRRRLLQAVGWRKMQVCCETWQDYSHEEGLQVLPPQCRKRSKASV